ncbi:hypothetical protein C0J52_14708 [Blattella germanica]|nr:hypothetical protein C0J52_14708 [Blattella germanica]
MISFFHRTCKPMPLEGYLTHWTPMDMNGERLFQVLSPCSIPMYQASNVSNVRYLMLLDFYTLSAVRLVSISTINAIIVDSA